MKLAAKSFLFGAIVFSLAISAGAQVEEICGDSGGGVVPWINTSFVYGKISLVGYEGRRPPKVVVVLSDSRNRESRYNIDSTGNYCFRETNGSNGFIVVEVENVEVARRSLPAGPGPAQIRQDFEITASHPDKQRPPSSISAKYNYPRTEANAALFEQAIGAEKEKDLQKAVQLLKQLVATDNADFIAWARLGSVYFDLNKVSDAETAYNRSVASRADYGPALVNLGRIFLVQKKNEQAIEVLLRATAAEPYAPRGFQLLGEAYLLVRKGTLGVQALNEAVRLDPVGMAECHLLMARLYDLAGAKPLASREYRMFLEKVPTHAERKKFERYIKDNPEDKDVQ